MNHPNPVTAIVRDRVDETRERVRSEQTGSIFAKSPFAPAVLTAATFAPSPFVRSSSEDVLPADLSPMAVLGGPMFRPRQPRRKPARRSVVMVGTPSRGASLPSRAWLPAEEIDYILEYSTGEYRWSVGDECDFTELAHQAVHVYGCEWGSCGAGLHEPHLHPLTAAPLPIGVAPVFWSELEQDVDDPAVATRRWCDAIAPAIVAVRELVLRNPQTLFNEPAVGDRRALEILSLAGRSLTRELLGASPVSVVLSAVESDQSIRAATADLGAMLFTAPGDPFELLIDQAISDGYRIWQPDELQYLAFSQPGSREPMELLGTYRVASASYHSVFDLPHGSVKLPWCLGWRELEMVTR